MWERFGCVRRNGRIHQAREFNRRRRFPSSFRYRNVGFGVEFAINVGVAQDSLNVLPGFVERDAFDELGRLAIIGPREPSTDTAGAGIVSGQGTEPVSIPAAKLLAKVLGSELDDDGGIQQQTCRNRAQSLLTAEHATRGRNQLHQSICIGPRLGFGVELRLLSNERGDVPGVQTSFARIDEDVVFIRQREKHLPEFDGSLIERQRKIVRAEAFHDA